MVDSVLLGVCRMDLDDMIAGKYHLRKAINITVEDCDAQDTVVLSYQNELTLRRRREWSTRGVTL